MGHSKHVLKVFLNVFIFSNNVDYASNTISSMWIVIFCYVRQFEIYEHSLDLVSMECFYITSHKPILMVTLAHHRYPYQGHKHLLGRLYLYLPAQDCICRGNYHKRHLGCRVCPRRGLLGQGLE